MARPATKFLAGAVVVLGMFVAAPSALAAPAVDGVFPVNGLETNNKLVAGPDGNIWVTLSVGNDVAKITPGGQVEEFELNETSSASGITVGPEGNLWVTENEGVTRFSPANPTLLSTNFPIGSVKLQAPIVLGPDGNLWVASENVLVRVPPSNPAAKTEFAVAGLSPRDIDVAGGLLAVADAGVARIATFTTSGIEQDYPIGEKSQGVAGGSGGQIAFSAPDAQQVGLISPPSPPQPVTIDKDPFGVAFGADGAYWIARSAADELIRLTGDGQITTLGGFPPKYFPRQVAPGPGNTIWVTMEIPGEAITAVARVSGVEPPVTNPPPPPAAPETKIGKGPKKVVKTRKKRAKVKFRFSSSSAGATFQCSMTRVKGKTTKVATFKGCQSPKVYRLRPGKYRFQVRAVLNGVADPTPAVREFRVIRIHRH